MSFLSRLNPVASFPAYTGPYSVGTHDVEIPISQLSSSSPAPDPELSTVSFRLFYPCERQQKRRKPVWWLPDPHGEYLRAYYRFMQASPWLALILSYLPLFRLLTFTSLPAIRDADPLQPPTASSGRWPVMVFSHGLGGSRNAYSHLCGSLASHGLVVLAPEHRDGSAPISFVTGEAKSKPKPILYRNFPHKETSEVEEGRNLQLKVRCWELALVHDALLRIEKGKGLSNAQASLQTPNILSALQSRLDVHTPGKIAWSGHSFGATTIIQFVKSVFHGSSPLYDVPNDSPLHAQITPSTPLSLLDIWTLPLLFHSASSLSSKPLPAYSTPTESIPSPPLAILSEGFYKWTSNLRHTIRAVSPTGTSDIRPHIFYPVASAHLSQSDFGLLFPWITMKLLKAQEPERTLRLNVRAILETLRLTGINVSETSRLDREISEDAEVEKSDTGEILGQDHSILSRDRSIRGWVPVDPDHESCGAEMNGGANKHAKKPVANGSLTRHATNGHATEPNGPAQAVLKNEVMK